MSSELSAGPRIRTALAALRINQTKSLLDQMRGQLIAAKIDTYCSLIAKSPHRQSCSSASPAATPIKLRILTDTEHLNMTFRIRKPLTREINYNRAIALHKLLGVARVAISHSLPCTPPAPSNARNPDKNSPFQGARFICSSVY